MARRRFDDWGRPTAAFSFRDLDRAAEAVPVPGGGLIVDPFAGSGRAGTFVTARGDQFLGIEAHVLMGELAALKSTRLGPPREFRQLAAELRDRARVHLAKVKLAGEDPVTRRFVPAEALGELVALRDCIEDIGGCWQQHLRWLVVDLLRQAAGSSWPYRGHRSARGNRRTPLECLDDRATVMAEDLSDAPRYPRSRIVIGDARDGEAWSAVSPGSVNGSISSPPYLNQISYVEVTRLELYFLGIVRSWREMTHRIGASLVASSTQQITIDRARAASEHLEVFPGTAATARSLAARLSRARALRPRGKAYDLLIPTYFADLACVLRNLHTAMAPGARAAWIVGDSAPYDVYVDTPAIIGLLAEEIGFELLGDQTLRARGGRWPGVGKRHGRPLTERLILFRRPAWGEQEELPGLD